MLKGVMLSCHTSSRDMVRGFSAQWEKGFSYLKQFSDREGHCRAPKSYRTDDGYRLGQWVRFQRADKKTMEPDRRQRLEALPGWDWNPLSTRWDDGFSHLQHFSDRVGHCRVSQSYRTDDGYRLGQWVTVQRITKRTLEPDRRQRLEGLPGWDWNPLSTRWDEGFSHLKHFSDRVGHCRVPRDFKADDGYQLGYWVDYQRQNKDSMDRERRQRLQKLSGWSWGPRFDRWEDGFSRLKRFSQREGHCRVPRSFKTDEGYRLGVWVGMQRANKDSMDCGHRHCLQQLPGWSWAPYFDRWEERFSYLEQFSDREGHCRVSQSYRTDNGYPLGQWVKVQRANKKTMEPDRRQRLEALPGWDWKVRK
jgi:hypothetical protein